MFVRVRLPLDILHAAVLVPDHALGTDQGDKYLLVVNAQSIVEYRRVKPGPLEEDGLRVISEGLKAGEKVIVSGLQIARPRMKVQQDVVKLLH
jgi:multidrug efflux pump subunit AcrA (membrane-fusion protein)